MSKPTDVTTLLISIREGAPRALEELFDLVYPELRRVAHRERARGPGATMNTTAVVHEAYLKLVGAAHLEIRDRAHFFAVAATAMRQLLVDQARRKLAQKRGGGAPVLELDSRALSVDDPGAVMIDLDRALDRLRELNERLVDVVSLRFFAGLEEREVGELLGVNERTVRRDWRKARAFLYHELYGSG